MWFVFITEDTAKANQLSVLRRMHTTVKRNNNQQRKKKTLAGNLWHLIGLDLFASIPLREDDLQAPPVCCWSSTCKHPTHLKGRCLGSGNLICNGSQQDQEWADQSAGSVSGKILPAPSLWTHRSEERRHLHRSRIESLSSIFWLRWRARPALEQRTVRWGLGLKGGGAVSERVASQPGLLRMPATRGSPWLTNHQQPAQRQTLARYN